jgi:putative MATE family efflux protein
LTTTGGEATDVVRPMLRLALPVLAEQVLAMLVGLVDTWLTGQFFSESHLAAMNLMAYALWTLPMMFSTVGIGATAMIARFIGARDPAQANRVAGQALLIGLAFTAVATPLAYLLTPTFVQVMRLDGDAAELAIRYLRIVVPAMPAMMVEVVGVACLRGAGRMVAGLVIMGVVNAVNAVASAGLATGFGRLPRLGWDGLAVGTAAGYAVGALLIVLLLAASRGAPRWRPADMYPDLAMCRRILRIGLPGGADMLAVNLCHLWFASIINGLGDIAAAAHGVAIRIESLSYLPGGAFQVAAATLSGQFLGARDYHSATRSVKLAALFAVGLMSTAGVVLFVGADRLTGLFLNADQAAVAAAAAPLLRIVSFSTPFLALLMVMHGGLRGAGDTRFPLLINFSGLLGVRIPTAYLLTSVWQLGVQGAWYAMVIDLTFRALLSVLRFRHGGWRRIEV